ncbi:MAG TPA: response regulator [Verrucomicrobiae bacterium]|jgi:DNA-binding NtrC family response regulator
MTTAIAPSAKPGPRRVLIVDDEEIVMVALCETLRREGYEVITAPNAVQALELLRTQEFGVILTDQQMPMLTGLELLTQARQLQPEASRVLITAVLNLSTVIDAINKAEIFRFILKPWERDVLLQIMEHAWQRHETIRRNQLLLEQTQESNARLTQLVQSLEHQLAEERNKSVPSKQE